ncbi:MAG: septum site-determining protein MinC [Gammaproteobacteria bacterium]|nr:septum site-determining protein MinC [Gammaproteobacteria bacterium]MCP5426253.1 septum site-determining protein MinC [Gammaproteobacteria bacterium]
MGLESATRFQAEQSSPFELKGSLFTLTVMHLRKADGEAIAHHLEQKTRQAPDFFKNLPLVIDLEALDSTVVPDFAFLHDLLRQHGLIPVGVRHGNAQLQSAALRAGIPILPEQRPAPAKVSDKAAAESPPTAPVRHNRTITHPIRTGQQVYVPDGDLILLGPISAGAEILAAGNIHVYGTLRGRALAGTTGDTEARIFCHSLEAEFVSIAGQWNFIEELEQYKDNRDKPVQIYLEKDRLVISPLYK